MQWGSSYLDAYRGLPRGVWLLAVAAFVNRMGTMVLPFLPLYVKEEHGYDVAEGGMMLAVYGVGAIGGAHLGGRLVRPLGPFAVQIASLLGAGVLFVLLERVTPGPIFWLGIAAAGFVVEMFRPANLAALLGTCPPDLHRRAFGLVRLAINVGTSISPAVAGLLAEHDFSLLFWVDAGTCVAAALFLWRVLPGIPQDAIAAVAADDPKASVRPFADRTFVLAMIATTAVWTIFFQVFATLSIDLREHYALEKDEIGLLFALNPAMIAVLEMPLVHRTRARAPLPVMALGAVLVGAGFGMHALGAALWIPIAAMVVITLGEMLESPATGSFVGSRASAEMRGPYTAVYSQTFGAAMVLGPLIGSLVYEHAGRTSLWAGCAVVGTLACLLLIRLHRSGPATSSN